MGSCSRLVASNDPSALSLQRDLHYRCRLKLVATKLDSSHISLKNLLSKFCYKLKGQSAIVVKSSVVTNFRLIACICVLIKKVGKLAKMQENVEVMVVTRLKVKIIKEIYFPKLCQACLVFLNMFYENQSKNPSFGFYTTHPTKRVDELTPEPIWIRQKRKNLVGEESQYSMDICTVFRQEPLLFCYGYLFVGYQSCFQNDF